MTDQVVSVLDLGLFTGIPQHDNFCRLASLLPSTEMVASSEPQPFSMGKTIDLPGDYQFVGASKSVENFFVETDTAALLVLRNGSICYERYALTGGVDVPWISMSVAKSFISALVGIAIAEGYVGSIHDPISDYVPVNRGSAYDGVSIKDVLQMSSGARWNEDYTDPASDVFRLASAQAGRTTHDDFVASMIPDVEPGTVCRYNSGDTQALGALLKHATKRSITTYMKDKLYEPLGMTSPGRWLVDASGMEMAYAGLNMTARDFAKLGELYRAGGSWGGAQLVPEPWVKASVSVGAPHLAPGKPFVGGQRFELGYGYQWWIADGRRGDYSAIGVYNQFIYVDPTNDVVIVKLSANRGYGTEQEESTNREAETVAFLRSISDAAARL